MRARLLLTHATSGGRSGAQLFRAARLGTGLQYVTPLNAKVRSSAGQAASAAESVIDFNGVALVAGGLG